MKKNNKIETVPEINDVDLEYIADQIKNGYTSGRADSEGKHISWTINLEVWQD